MTTSVDKTIEGIIDGRNDTGIRIDGAWLNRSKFKPVELPDVGTFVRVRLDPKGFIHSLEILDSKLSERKGAGVDRDDRISKLAILKAAALFGASRPDLKSGDVLKIAQSWLEWVEADGGPHLD